MKKILIVLLLIIATATLTNAQYIGKTFVEMNFKNTRPMLIKKATLIKERQKKLLMEEYGFKPNQADTIAAIQYNLTLFLSDSLYMCAKTKADRYAIHDTAFAHYYVDLKNALKSDDLVAKVKEDDERRSLTQDYWMFGGGERQCYTLLWVHSIKRKMFSLNQFANRYRDAPISFNGN